MDGSMNLADALGGGPQAAGGAVWPGGNTQPQWPGSNNPAWPAGQPANPTWPGGQPGQPGGQPQWPGQPGGQPQWPGGQPGQPGGQPQWPGQPGGQPGQPGQPQWPGAPGPTPTWPGQPGQPSAPGGWPSPAPGQAPSPVIPTAPQKSLAVPYEHALTHGVYDKLLITISGIIKHNPDRITLDFLTTNGDLAFHFNPRFKEGGRKVIVRNSCLSGKWGPEEREASSFPFTAGQAFEIKVMCTGQEFKVAVNGSHLLAYKHRMHNLTSITRLNVTNDLSLTSVTDTRLP